MTDRPLDTLEASLGESVTVQLKDDTTYEGVLAGYDQHMNLVISEPAEPGDNTTVIRGDNVVSIEL